MKGSPAGRVVALAGSSLAIVAAFYLLREDWGHALGILPYGLLLACPLLHVFHGHSGHRHSQGDQARREP